jgi:hypothetical protein
MPGKTPGAKADAKAAGKPASPEKHDEKLREKRRLERETRIVHGLPPLLPTFCMRNCASIVRFFVWLQFPRSRLLLLR